MLDRDLRARLAEHGVFPEFIAVEFERVMQVVFAVPDWYRQATHPSTAAADEWPSPSAHTMYVAEPNGTLNVYRRQNDGGWAQTSGAAGDTIAEAGLSARPNRNHRHDDPTGNQSWRESCHVTWIGGGVLE